MVKVGDPVIVVLDLTYIRFGKVRSRYSTLDHDFGYHIELVGPCYDARGERVEDSPWRATETVERYCFNEGTTWARGWHTKDAEALRTAVLLGLFLCRGVRGAAVALGASTGVHLDNPDGQTQHVATVSATDVPTIGSEIRRLRTAMGLTLEEFGPKVGIPWQTVAKYESDKVTPPATKLLAILHATRGVEPPFRVGRVAKAAARSIVSGLVRAAA